jgi:hypothetical protein
MQLPVFTAVVPLQHATSVQVEPVIPVPVVQVVCASYPLVHPRAL